jgi:hypothetical protein
MKRPAPLLLTGLLAAIPLPAAAGPTAAEHLATIAAQIVAPHEKSAPQLTCGATRRIPQKPNTTFPTGLPPIMHAGLLQDGQPVGYVMWDDDDRGALAEFSLDLPVEWKQLAACLPNVPPLQQFPLPDPPHGTMASGCVPTAAGSVLAFWAQTKFPAWKGDITEDLAKGLTLRIRSRLTMIPFPDHDGFTPDGMCLAGAMPQDLAKAINADALAGKVPLKARYRPFAAKPLLTELLANRPVLVSCQVRLPHKPELSWGHELVAVAYLKLNQTSFLGVLDNYYPTNLRWLRTSFFDSMIFVEEISEP